MSNSVNFKPFELTGEVELPKLTASGFKREGDTARYVCKITDAVINFAGDNSKFAKDDKKKLINTLFLVLPKEQSENLQSIIDETGKKENLPYKKGDGEKEIKVKLNPRTKFMDKDGKLIKIDLKKVPCEELREYVGATIDLAITGESKEFESEAGKFSYVTLTAIQIKVKDMNSIFDCDFL